MLTAFELDVLGKISDDMNNLVVITQSLQENLILTAIALKKLELGLGTNGKQAEPTNQELKGGTKNVRNRL